MLPADFLETLRARYAERGDEVGRSTVGRRLDILRRGLTTLYLVSIDHDSRVVRLDHNPESRTILFSIRLTPMWTDTAVPRNCYRARDPRRVHPQPRCAEEERRHGASAGSSGLPDTRDLRQVRRS